jgi:hypothetical protein
MRRETELCLIGRCKRRSKDVARKRAAGERGSITSLIKKSSTKELADSQLVEQCTLTKWDDVKDSSGR